jgi:hypothetical protein
MAFSKSRRAIRIRPHPNHKAGQRRMAQVRQAVCPVPHRRIFMREPAERCTLASPRVSSASRHIGGLVPAEHRPRRRKIADFQQVALQLNKFGPGRLAVARCLGGCRARLCASAGPGLAGLVHVRGSLLPGDNDIVLYSPNNSPSAFIIGLFNSPARARSYAQRGAHGEAPAMSPGSLGSSRLGPLRPRIRPACRDF